MILRDCFTALHLGDRRKVPPFFVFTKGPVGRDVVFRGLAAPGAPGLGPTEDLVAIWKAKEGERFQNYRAMFTILDTALVPRIWIRGIEHGRVLSESCPTVWREWVEEGVYRPLRASRTVEHRSKDEQLPSSGEARRVVQAIHEYFKDDAYGFEQCAAELVRLMDSNFVSCDLTRRWVDGGRDAVGEYRIGLQENSIKVKFALEAKCYSIDNAVRVRHSSRLISRLRYRQFGVLVTTSYLHHQAYRELKEDRHIVIVIAARDFARILSQVGHSTQQAVETWLHSKFPRSAPAEKSASH